MTTLMRPYLELEKAVAEALGWKEVSIHGDIESPNWNTAWHNQTELYGCPPDKDITIHLPNFRVPRFIYDGKIMDLIDEFELDIHWYTESVGVEDSFGKVFNEINEKFCDHPSKKIAVRTALVKMVVAIKLQT